MLTINLALAEEPVIAAVKNDSALEQALTSPCAVIFLLYGNICNIKEKVQRIQQNGKQVFLHMELLDGFGRDLHAVRFISEQIMPNGIITTKTGLVKIARELGLSVIQRLFLIDNLSYETGIQSLRQSKPDAVEIMPGIIPKMTQKICQAVSIPVITGGLVNEKSDIIASLNAGAVGVSTSNPVLWES